MSETNINGYSSQQSLAKKALDVISVTATTDAESIGDNKVISQSIEIPYAFSVEGGSSLVKSITVFDDTNTKPAIDIVFSSVNTAITQDEGKLVGEDVDDLDAVFASALGIVKIVTGDYSDLADCAVGSKYGIDLAVQGASGTKSMYMHIINRSGGNWTATSTDDMKVKIGVMKD
tara:strand:+ start:522 stop:1046 length:525 start_codon:yes stop_codon:yes gene_type:complete